MKMPTSKKSILITGAGSGIGKAAAFALARRGHQVIATTHTSESATHLANEAKKLGFMLTTRVLDVTIPLDRETILEDVIDVLINNAGMGETGSLAEIPLDRVRRNFEVNVFSPLALTQLALRGMMGRTQGTVIFISSLAGRFPVPFLNPYSMTKFALSGGIAALRTELHRVAPDVHVSLIEPGTYATGFNQKMLEKKYEWMNESSYFYALIPTLKKEESRLFSTSEEKSTRSIVNKIVEAAEAKIPRVRYSAPWYQAFGVALLRAFGI